MKRDLQAALVKIKDIQAELVNNRGANPLFYRLKGFRTTVRQYLKLFEFELKTEELLMNLANEDLTVYDVLAMIEQNLEEDDTDKVKLNTEQQEALKAYLPKDVGKYARSDIGNAILLALMNEYFNADIIRKIDDFRTTSADVKRITAKSVKDVTDAIMRSFLWAGYLIDFYLGLDKQSSSRIGHIFQQAARVTFWGIGYSTLIIASLVNFEVYGKMAASVYGLKMLYEMYTTVFPLLTKAFGAVTKATFSYLFGSFFSKKEKQIILLKEKEIRKIIHEAGLSSTSSAKMKTFTVFHTAVSRHTTTIA